MRASGLYYGGLRLFGLAAAMRLLRDAAVVLCYHNVLADTVPALENTSLHITQERFRRQMQWLVSRYSVVPLTELLARVRAGKPLRRVAAITFDDAYRGVFDYAAPVLRELSVSATVFVVTDAPERGDVFWWDHPTIGQNASGPRREHWLIDLRGDAQAILASVGSTHPGLPDAARPASWDMIRAGARSGLHLGVHSASHRTLPRLTDAELRSELVDSRETLGRQSGVQADLFAYPYGLWDRRVRDATQAAGYAMAVTLSASLVSANVDPWSLPRVNIPARIGDSAFEAWVSGFAPHGPDGA